MRNKIKIININDNDYPYKLKNIYNPPLNLYILGNRNILSNFSIAIIGTRLCSDYGKYVAKKISYELAKKNVNIISGMAKGIDSVANIGCMEAKTETIAVVGCGLDIVYPAENKYLFNKILQNNGAIISEYPIGVKPEKNNFPARNRIISGLSDGVVVIEAKKRSGTFITVDFALEQGKNVFAIPGNITSSNSEGTNELLKQGAKMVTNVEDILEEYYFKIS